MEEYDKLALVGRGAFGCVYLCRKDSGERVILKEIVIEHLNEKEKEETIQEVKVMSLLKHPHIVRYFNSFNSHGALVIVMEYATKGTLHDYLQHQKQLLSQQVILNFFAQLCLALQYIHSKRILHRDITTRNILLTGSQGQIVKLSDFGISKILTSRTKTQSVVGTPGYMSPELCAGKAYGAPSDVWALGCVLYHMCTLRPAFQAETLHGLVMEIMHGAIEPISPSYDSGMMEILGLMLHRDPLDRPSATGLLSHRLVAPVAVNIIATLGCLARSDHDDTSDSSHKFQWDSS